MVLLGKKFVLLVIWADNPISSSGYKTSELVEKRLKLKIVIICTEKGELLGSSLTGSGKLCVSSLTQYICILYVGNVYLTLYDCPINAKLLTRLSRLLQDEPEKSAVDHIDDSVILQENNGKVKSACDMNPGKDYDHDKKSDLW